MVCVAPRAMFRLLMLRSARKSRSPLQPHILGGQKPSVLGSDQAEVPCDPCGQAHARPDIGVLRQNAGGRSPEAKRVHAGAASTWATLVIVPVPLLHSPG